MKHRVIINIIGKTQTGKTWLAKYIQNFLAKDIGLQVNIYDGSLAKELSEMTHPEPWEWNMLSKAHIELNEINISRKTLGFLERLKYAWQILKTGDLLNELD